MFLRFKAFEAPLRYQFPDPDTGFMYRAATEVELYTAINSYREQNELEPLDGLNLVVENYLCSLPENSHKCQPRGELHRSLATYVKGGLALLKNMAFKKFAPIKVATERAEICVKCPYNVFPDKDHFVKWSDGIAIQCVGDRKVRADLHDNLGTCAVCSCTLKSKVHFDGKLDPFNKEDLVKLKAVGCWQPPLAGQ